MIPVIEDYLSELIEAQFTRLYTTPTLVNTMLINRANRLSELLALLQSGTQIPIIWGYPRPTAQLPVICLMLSEDDEEELGLGDEDDYLYDETTSTVTGESQSVVYQPGAVYNNIPYIQVANPNVYSISSITNTSTNTTLDPSAYYLADATPGYITLDPSVVSDGDTLQVTYDYMANGNDPDTEVMYSSNFKIEVWSNNGVLTSQLYNLLKWALIDGRETLLGDGLFRQKLGGSDLYPAPQYFPSFVYRRALTFWCQYKASTQPSTQTSLITGVTVDTPTTFSAQIDF